MGYSGISLNGDTIMRTITDLLELDGRVYIYLATPEIKAKFLTTAENEMFTFENGTLPTEAISEDNIIAINDNHTLRELRWAGHLLFFSEILKTSEGAKIYRVDFEKYMSGSDDFSWNKS